MCNQCDAGVGVSGLCYCYTSKTGFSIAKAPTNGLLHKLGLYPNCLQNSPLFHFCGWKWLAANFATIRGMRTDDL